MSNATPNSMRVDGLDALRAACDRNCPLSVVRPELAGQAPFANGRMIAMNDDVIEIENVQVIGRNVSYAIGQLLDAFFNLDGEIFRFRTSVVQTQEPIRLNKQMIVRGMVVETPAEVTIGQRRNSYRISLASRRISIDAWWIAKLTESGDIIELPPMDGPPIPDRCESFRWIGSRDHDYQGTLSDISDRGIGLYFPHATYTSFRVFERLLAKFTLPHARVPLVCPVEVRQSRRGRNGGAVIGTVYLPDADPNWQHHQDIIRQSVSELQRDELRRRAENAA